jgi:glycosyltransferase involved in cell wall biosynthesis
MVQVLHNYRPFCANGCLYTDGQVCERCAGGRHWNAVIHKCMRDSRTVSAIYAATMWNLKRSSAFDQIRIFICPSESARLQAVKNGIEPSKIVVRPHSVKVNEIAPGVGAGEYFLYLGRLSSEKGVWTLLQAFENLPGVPLLIAGTGPLAEKMQAFIEDHHMNHVKMLGFQAGDDKLRLLQNARAVIVPSEFLEIFGITVIEAYAAARPVIASDLGSLPYLIRDHETGLLFRPGDASALRTKVAELMADQSGAVRMGQAGRRVAEFQHSPQAAFESLMKVFERAVLSAPEAVCCG